MPQIRQNTFNFPPKMNMDNDIPSISRQKMNMENDIRVFFCFFLNRLCSAKRKVIKIIKNNNILRSFHQIKMAE